MYAFVTEEYGKGVLLFCDSCGILFKDRCSRDACCYFLNMQGDVMAILNSSGVAVVEYTYDAWGKPLTTTGSMASGLGQINPLRYRGYVYDQETGLYYLQSRYYNPEIGRFINADKYISTGHDILGSNAYAYCLNNPMNHVDSTGTLAVSLSLLILGTVIGGVFSAGIDAGIQLYKNGGDISELDVGSIIKSGLVGCALGLSTAMGVGYLGPIINGTAVFSANTATAAFGISVGVSALAAGTGYVIEERLNNREISAKGILVNAGITALQSAVNFGAGGMIGSIGNVGTKGPFFSGEWFGKFVLVQEFSFPFKYITNMLIDIFE